MGISNLLRDEQEMTGCQPCLSLFGMPLYGIYPGSWLSSWGRICSQTGGHAGELDGTSGVRCQLPLLYHILRDGPPSTLLVPFNMIYSAHIAISSNYCFAVSKFRHWNAIPEAYAAPPAEFRVQ